MLRIEPCFTVSTKGGCRYRKEKPMPMSAAALEGIAVNGHAWKRRIRLGQWPALIGKYNDARGTEREATDRQVEAAALRIVEAVRRFAPNAPNDARDDLLRSADGLELLADCGLEDVNEALGELYDSFDYWRILVESVRLRASADTHPKGGDVKQAPLVSGAVPEGQTPKVQRHD